MGLSELRSTLWTRLYIAELRCTLVSYTALIGAVPHTYELCCTLVSYAAPFWATLHPAELSCPLLTYAAPYWADWHPSELPCTLSSRLYHAELLCTLMSYAAPLWATGLGCTLLSCAANCWTMLQCLSYCTLTMLPPFLQFFRCRTVWHPASPVLEWKEMQMPEPVRCRNRETQADTRAFWYWDDRWRNTNADAQLWVPG